MKWNPATRRRDEHGHGLAWKGGRHVDKQGYVRVFMPDHPHADTKGYVKEHLIVVTRAMGKPLRAGAEVHHVNEEKADNVPPNLVACDSRGYHLLLHYRTRALDACGHASWLRCTFCQHWDSPERLYKRRNAAQAWHPDCQRTFRTLLKKGTSSVDALIKMRRIEERDDRFVINPKSHKRCAVLVVLNAQRASA